MGVAKIVLLLIYKNRRSTKVFSKVLFETEGAWAGIAYSGVLSKLQSVSVHTVMLLAYLID